MASLRQIRSFFLTISLTVMLAITVGFDFGSTASLFQMTPPPQVQIASMNPGTMAKGIEGQAQEAIGNLTGNHKDQIMGKVKQAEAQALNAAEDLKDNIDFQGKSQTVQDRVEDQAKNLKNNIKDFVN